MSDLSNMPDAELSMHIQNLERFLGAPTLEPWGIRRPHCDMQARLERLRAEQARRIGVVPESRPYVSNPRLRTQAIRMGGMSVDRAKVAIEEAIFVLMQGKMEVSLLQDALGLVDRVHAELADLGAPIHNLDERAPDGKDAFGRKVRYLSQREHELLELAAAEGGCLVLDHPVSEAREVLCEAGLMMSISAWAEGDTRARDWPIPEGKRRVVATPKGRRALETWHYHVD